MAGALSKSQLAAALAEKSGLTKKGAAELLDHLALLACQHAKESFTIPGIGKLVLVDRKARMGHNPKTLEPMPIKARKVLRFRFCQSAKDAILGPKPTPIPLPPTPHENP